MGAKPRRRWLRFSLGGLLVMMLLVSGRLAIWSNDARHQKRAVEAIERAGGYVTFDTTRSRAYRDSLARIKKMKVPGRITPKIANKLPEGLLSEAQLSRRDWIREHLGSHFADRIHSIGFTMSEERQANWDFVDELVQQKRIPSHDAFRQFSRLPHPPPDASAWQAIQSLPSIQAASLSFMCTDDDLKEVCRIPQLRHLSIATPQITDAGMRHIDQAKYLERLSISPPTSITIKSLGGLRELKRLQYVSLGGSMTIGDAEVQEFEGLTNLISVNLVTWDLSDEGLKSLAPLTKLDELDLRNNAVTDKGIAWLREMQGLNHLNLSGTAVTDAGLTILRRMASLQHVDVTNTQVTQDAVDALRASRPTLTVLANPSSDTP